MTELEAQQQLDLVDAELDELHEELKSVPAYSDEDAPDIALENLNRQIELGAKITEVKSHRVKLMARANSSKITLFHQDIKDLLVDHVSLISDEYEALGAGPIDTIVWTREGREVIQDNGVQETEYLYSLQVNPVSKRKVGTRKSSGDGITSSSTATRTVNGTVESMTVKDVCLNYASDEIKEMSAW